MYKIGVFSVEEEFQSQLLNQAVTELSRLPGVGRKTALRLALHLLRQDATVTDALSTALMHMRHEIRYCAVCHNISETDVCPICSSAMRDNSVVCVVENVKDVMLFENTGIYNGLYHVLGGVISPIDGIGPDKLEIDSLVKRVATGNVKEVILALGATMEGETTNFYIYRRLADSGVKISQLARGVAVGNDIEYTDEITLGRSLRDRILFKN